MLTLLAISNLIALVAIFFSVKKYLEHRQNSASFQRLIDRINVGCYRYRLKDGVVLRANRGFVEILELDMGPGEVVGRSVRELMIYVEGENSIREQVRERGELRNYEYHFKTLKGNDKWVLHNSYLVRDPFTGDEAIEAMVQDITEEKVAYEKMKQSQERYEKLFSNSADMVIIYKVSGSAIEEINPVTEVITGFSSKELIGKAFDSLFHPSSRAKLSQAQEDLLFKGGSQLEAVVVCRNGSYKEVFLTMSLVELNEERMVMVIAKDISEFVKGMDEQKRRKAELEDFWKAAVEREERIKDLRHDLDRVKEEIRILKEGK
jgi:PAS domain S-box-containing protein